MVDLPASELINQGEDGGEGNPIGDGAEAPGARLKRVNRISSPERWELKQMLAAKVITGVWLMIYVLVDFNLEFDLFYFSIYIFRLYVP